MKFPSKKLLLVIPAIALTSCGYSLSYLVEGNKYNSPVFIENFYKNWDKDLLEADEVKNVDFDCITNYAELSSIDMEAAQKYANVDAYGKGMKMNNINSIFNYGYQSKLFDGRVYCEGYFQLSRVQVDRKGFSIAFSKESSELKYLAINFKSSVDYTKFDPGSHLSTIHMSTSLYCKNDKNIIEKYTYNSIISNPSTNDGNYYIFYGIDLHEEHLSRVVGYSITYDYEDDKISPKDEDEKDKQYALFLYELFMPYTNWH